MKEKLFILFPESNSALTENDTEIVGQGISMLVEIMTMEPKLWPAFYNYKGIKKWLFLLVLKSPDLKVREYAATGVVRLVQRARRLYVLWLATIRVIPSQQVTILSLTTKK